MVFIVNEGLLTKFQTGVITAAFYVAYAILQIVGGVLTDKWNPERFVTVGLVGAGVSNLVIFFNQSYSVMLISWVMNACLQFAVWPATFKIVSTLLRSDMQERSLLIATLGNPIGVVLSYAIAAFIGSEWKMNFLVASLGLFVIALMWELAVKITKPYIETTEIPLPTKSENKKSQDREFLKIALGAGLILLLILSFTRTMFDLGMKAVAPTMINESYGDISPVFATALSIIILISGAAGPFLSGFIYPRFLRNEAVIVTIFFAIATPLTAAMLFIGKAHYILIVILLNVKRDPLNRLGHLWLFLLYPLSNITDDSFNRCRGNTVGQLGGITVMQNTFPQLFLGLKCPFNNSDTVKLVNQAILEYQTFIEILHSL